MFDEILNDRVHGSYYIMIKSLEEASQALSTKNATYEEVVAFFKELRETFPDMKVIESLNIESTGGSELKLLRNIQLRLQSMHNEIRCIIDTMKEILKGISVVMVISYSTTVLKVLNNVFVRIIYVMESEPGAEGRQFAEDIKSKSIIKLVSDKEGLNVVERGVVSAILMGCEKFNSEVGFVNKVGSRELVESAIRSNTPVYVMASKYKEEDKDKIMQVAEKSLVEFVPLSENIHLIGCPPTN